MSILRELKRRNVIKVAIAYGIVAWLLIEVTATIFPILQLPDWSVTMVTVLILIGFPVALIFACRDFRDRRHGRQSGLKLPKGAGLYYAKDKGTPLMSILRELKRRNVIKVAIAYGIVAWLLIEVTATIFPILQLPDWSVTMVTVLILIGFPVALIFAWAFENTPEGIKLEKDVDRSQSITHITGRNIDYIIIAALRESLEIEAASEISVLAASR